MYEAARHGLAPAGEFGLALLTFILASTGILLLIHGSRLFERVDVAHGNDGSRPERLLTARLLQPIMPVGRAFDTRHGASMMQARHAILTAGRAPRTQPIYLPRHVIRLSRPLTPRR